ncbi:MAG: HAMP domain-containing sensor histidine kinase [Bacteroidia bacterium]
MKNKLLQRQIRKFFAEADQLPDNLAGLFKIIGESYDHYEKDREMLERSIDISSSEMIELNNKLRKESDELKKANMELDKFVYSVSHDLRAPLKSMTGIVEITGEMSDDPIVHEHLEMLKSSISKLDTFIIDMLDCARNARADIKKEEIDFNEMLNDITNNLKHMSDNHREVSIDVNVVNNQKPFYSDKGRINVLLSNLISNAIRYQNPEISEPFVKIKVDTSDKEVNIIINDNGIGISNELHEKIFEMFYRVTENSVGSGLGLYLVKETVDKLQGEISVESKPGLGTKFSLNIPNLYSQQFPN